jgi:hypothetical protein
MYRPVVSTMVATVLAAVGIGLFAAGDGWPAAAAGVAFTIAGVHLVTGICAIWTRRRMTAAAPTTPHTNGAA